MLMNLFFFCRDSGDYGDFGDYGGQGGQGDSGGSGGQGGLALLKWAWVRIELLTELIKFSTSMIVHHHPNRGENVD